MDDAERAFRDALHRADSVKIPVPSLEPADVRRGPGIGVMMSRWLAAAAVFAVVAGIAVWAFAERGQTVEGVPGPRPTPVTQVTLTGTTWMALELYGTPTKPAPEKVPFLEFRADSTFYGGDPCNQFHGTYWLVGDALTLSTVAKTEIGCNVSQQQLFDKVMTNVRRVQRDGDTITLLDQPGNVLGLFSSSAGYTEPGPTPSAPAPSIVPDSPTSTASASVVTIRVHNASSVDFESVEISFSGQRMTFGPIAAGKATRFQKTDKANYFAPITVVTADATYRFEETPSVGAPLTTGQYTYTLDIVDGALTLATIIQR